MPRKRNKRLEELGREGLEDLYVNKEMTTDEIAAAMECSRQTVCTALKRHGIEIRKGKDQFVHGINFSPEFLKYKGTWGKTGEEAAAWKGGEYVDGDGYRRVYVNGEYKREHRLVAENMRINNGGPPLSPEEDVHHINGNKLDNRPENLQIVSKDLHNEIHEAEKEEKYG